MNNKDERGIARKSEQMLTDALRHAVAGFKTHYYSDVEEEKKALKNAVCKAKVKKYGLVKDGTAQFYLRGLGIRMDKHGFVQHYGVNTIREGGERKRKRPKATAYSFRHHHFKMKTRPFIDRIVEQSGVIPFVLDAVTRHRGEELMLTVKKYMED